MHKNNNKKTIINSEDNTNTENIKEVKEKILKKNEKNNNDNNWNNNNNNTNNTIKIITNHYINEELYPLVREFKSTKPKNIKILEVIGNGNCSV